MLVDNVTITIKAGNGGNGAVHFKRNAQTAKGGPDGGNAGNGGNIYFQGTDDLSALQQFRYKKRIMAETGINGGGQNKFGRNGEDTIIKVPFGTEVTDTSTGQVYEINNTEVTVLLAQGGKGGRGNNEFKTATDQTPYYAEKGTPGEEKEIRLELKLIADVGLIGLPNAGKSSLLSALTNAHPKIGDYPFTTLEPNLGVMEGVVLADIPGLIAGASDGKGLGIKFLQHIEKTKLLLHCVAVDNENLQGTYETIRKELAQYSKTLLEKPEIILITKSDLVPSEELKEKVKIMKKKNKNILAVSIYDEKSLDALQEKLTTQLK